jgi:hypothetical protein
VILRRLSSNKVSISFRRDSTDLEAVFTEGAITAVLQFVESTEVGKRLSDDTNKGDSWDIHRLDRDKNEDTTERDRGRGEYGSMIETEK